MALVIFTHMEVCVIVFEPVPVKKGSLASRFTKYVKDLTIPLAKVELVDDMPIIDNSPDHIFELKKSTIMSIWLGFTHDFDQMLTDLEKTYERIRVKVSDEVYKFEVDAQAKEYFIVNFMREVSKHTSVTSIDLYNSNIVASDTLNILIEAMPERSIYKLQLPAQISPQAVIDMCQCLSGRTIRSLDLSNINLNGAPFAQVKKLIDSSKTCRHLSVNTCQLDDNDMNALCDSLAHLDIRGVELSENQFSSVGLKTLAEQLPQTRVRTLIAHDNVVNAKDVRLAFLSAFKVSPITDYFNVLWAYPHQQKDETFEDKRKKLSQSFDEGRGCAEFERKAQVQRGVIEAHTSSYLLATYANKAFLTGYLAYKRVAHQKDSKVKLKALKSAKNHPN